MGDLNTTNIVKRWDRRPECIGVSDTYVPTPIPYGMVGWIDLHTVRAGSLVSYQLPTPSVVPFDVVGWSSSTIEVSPPKFDKVLTILARDQRTTSARLMDNLKNNNCL